LDEETNNSSTNFLFAFFGALGIKIIIIDRCLENSAPGSKTQNRGKSGGWEWVWGWGEDGDGEDGPVQESDKMRQEMITDIRAGKYVLTPGGAASDIARIWGVASHYDDLYRPMCATSGFNVAECKHRYAAMAVELLPKLGLPAMECDAALYVALQAAQKNRYGWQRSRFNGRPRRQAISGQF
jgi:hypothetical protein